MQLNVYNKVKFKKKRGQTRNLTIQTGIPCSMQSDNDGFNLMLESLIEKNRSRNRRFVLICLFSGLRICVIE